MDIKELYSALCFIARVENGTKYNGYNGVAVYLPGHGKGRITFLKSQMGGMDIKVEPMTFSEVHEAIQMNSSTCIAVLYTRESDNKDNNHQMIIGTQSIQAVAPIDQDSFNEKLSTLLQKED